jgi:hypothetical protein
MNQIKVNDQFYSRLAANKIPLSNMLTREHFFKDVPADWHVIITDIKNSTNAVAGGMHETVNLIATGSIVTVLNLVYKANITIPFFFGGDGATFLLPASMLGGVMEALVQFKANTLESFNLELRVGTIPVSAIYAEGHQLRLSKFQSSRILSIPVLLGNGLSYAEKVIKGEDYLFSLATPPPAALDLSGMQCRWDRIDPPEDHYEVVTLLVISGAGFDQGQSFKKVIKLIDDIYGSPDQRQPISVSKLKLKTTFTRIEMILRANLERIAVFNKIYTWLTYLIGYLYFSTQSGKDYLHRLVSMSDTLVIDGRINTVITGTAGQRKRMEQILEKLEKKGEIRYGLYVSKDSVMSCYVRDLQDDHIHFVDGSEGGYTQAATVLKAKLRVLATKK